MSNSKKLQYYQLFDFIVNHPDLKGHHHTLHAILYTRCKLNNGKIKLSRHYLADKLQCSERSISNYLEALEKADPNFHYRRTGRSNLFWFSQFLPLFSDVQNSSGQESYDLQLFSPLEAHDLKYFSLLIGNKLQDSIYKDSLKLKFKERTGRELSTARASELNKWEREQLYLHRLSIDELTSRFWAPVFSADDWIKNKSKFLAWSYKHTPTYRYRSALAKSPWFRKHKKFCIDFFLKHSDNILAGKYEKLS